MSSFTVDDLVFELRPSRRRQSLQITVDRGGELVLFAPEDCPPERLKTFVRAKRPWIYTKLAEKAALAAETPPKRYVSGEGFPYLGRSYRLLLVDEQTAPVKLHRGRFCLRRADAPQGREHMIRWYTTHAHRWLRPRLPHWTARLDVEPAALKVQDLGYRWGSCGKGDVVYVHWKTILLPPALVEYVLVHELIHLHEPHHTPHFWARLERALPDYAERKERLAEKGAGWVGV